MRYIDVTNSDGIVQNVKASDLRFKSVISNTINTAPGVGNLAGVNNLADALAVVDTLSTGTGTDSLEVERVINNINDNNVMYEGAVNVQHIFNHNLDTEFFQYNIWVLETAGWQNSIVPITIINENTVQVDLSPARACRIILQSIENISKTYGI
jgi:hypothetical protein